MTRLFIHLSKEAKLEKNKKLLSEVYTSDLNKLRFLFEKYPRNQIARVIDKKMTLDLFLENIDPKYTAKLTLGRISDELPMIESWYYNVFTPRSNVERSVNWFCPWTRYNFDKLNDIFQKVYGKGILDFPLIR